MSKRPRSVSLAETRVFGACLKKASPDAQAAFGQLLTRLSPEIIASLHDVALGLDGDGATTPFDTPLEFLAHLYHEGPMCRDAHPERSDAYTQLTCWIITHVPLKMDNDEWIEWLDDIIDDPAADLGFVMAVLKTLTEMAPLREPANKFDPFINAHYCRSMDIFRAACNLNVDVIKAVSDLYLAMHHPDSWRYKTEESVFNGILYAIKRDAESPLNPDKPTDLRVRHILRALHFDGESSSMGVSVEWMEAWFREIVKADTPRAMAIMRLIENTFNCKEAFMREASWRSVEKYHTGECVDTVMLSFLMRRKWVYRSAVSALLDATVEGGSEGPEGKAQWRAYAVSIGLRFFE